MGPAERGLVEGPVKKLIISAPFGNYVESQHATSTLGTYTVANRAGFLRWRTFWRVALTLRYRRALGGWTNKLGLPNPGMTHLLKVARSGGAKGRIVSLQGLSESEWPILLHAAGSLVSTGEIERVELNVSCPNVGHLSVPPSLFREAVDRFGRERVIVKLSPVNYWTAFKLARDAGVRFFHCTNTLPCPAGGLSGKALKRVSLDVVARVKAEASDVTIIGGGGISTPQDVKDYRSAGADHVAVASALLHPRGWFARWREPWLASLAQAAH